MWCLLLGQRVWPVTTRHQPLCASISTNRAGSNGRDETGRHDGASDVRIDSATDRMNVAAASSKSALLPSFSNHERYSCTSAGPEIVSWACMSSV